MTKPSTFMDLVANSTPIVDFDSKLNAFLVNLEKRLDFPTPESPIRTTKKLKYSRRPLKRCMSKAMSLYCCKIVVCLHPSYSTTFCRWHLLSSSDTGHLKVNSESLDLKALCCPWWF